MADEFDRLLRAAGEWKQPPVSRWRPAVTRDMDLVIGRDGEWRYRGTPFARRDIVTLLSGLLVNEDGVHYLVSPAERLRIEVEDTPFLVTDFEHRGTGTAQRLLLETNVGQIFPLDAGHPLHMREMGPGRPPEPVVSVRDGLLARFTRSAFYRLVEIGEERVPGLRREFGVWSYGDFFPLGEVTW